MPVNKCSILTQLQLKDLILHPSAAVTQYVMPILCIAASVFLAVRMWKFVIRVRPIPCRHPIPNTIGRSYTDTDTDAGLYKFFCTENAILWGV